MEIKFDVYFKKNLGTLCKDNEVDLDGKEAYINLDLSLVDRLEVNYSVGGTKYTDEVTIKDIDNKEILIPFKSDVVKKGLNEFEIVAYMKNGDIKVSQTYIYDIEQGIGEGQTPGNSGDVDLSKYATRDYVDNAISRIELTPGPKGDKGDKGDVGPQGPAGAVDTSNFYNKTEVNEIVNELKGNQSNSSAIVKDIFANNELPRIYITSDKLGLLASKSDPEAMCGCEIKINNKTIKCYATGKVQGTTSATFPAKNFTFKFYSDKECLSKQKIDVGWGEQYKYCFKKNWVDTTHTRNLAGARIAYDMVESRPSSDFKSNLQTAPRNGVVDGFPCKLYINGEFWGLYTWNIPKDDWMFNMDSDNPNHMVLCGERNNDGNMNIAYSTQFRKLWDGNDGAEWSIEVGNLSDELKNSFNNAISFVMTASDAEFKNNISNYFDLYSLLDYYIFSYFACHYDGLGKNMLIGTYDGVQWGAMLYDMDSIFGAVYNGSSFMPSDRPCPSGYQESNSLLWQRIEKCFANELKKRYFELRKNALSLGNVITHVEEIYDLIPDRVFNDEKNKWASLPSLTTNTITRFRNYMRDRAKYVDDKFKELIVEKVPCTGILLSDNSLIFEEDNTQTLVATVSPINTTDKVVWSVSPSGIAAVDNGVISPIANGECVITAACGDYSATCNVSVEFDWGSGESGPRDGYVRVNYAYIPNLLKHSATTNEKYIGFESGYTDTDNLLILPSTGINTDEVFGITLPYAENSVRAICDYECVFGALGGNRNYLGFKIEGSKLNNYNNDIYNYLADNPIYADIKLANNCKSLFFDIENNEISIPGWNNVPSDYAKFEFEIENSDLLNYSSAVSSFGRVKKGTFNIVPDTPVGIGATQYLGKNLLGVVIKKSLLKEDSVEGFKEYVRENPIIIYYI